MRTRDPSLLPILRSRLIGDLLALLASDPQQWWTLDEIATRTGGSYPTVTREIRRLEQADLIEVEEVGRSKRVRINMASPFYNPLAELIVRAFGPVFVVGDEFAGLVGVDEVSIYGSWAARYLGQPGATPNDVDVLVLGEPDRDDIYAAARRAEKRLGLPVNTIVRRGDDWAKADDSFALQVKASARVIAPTYSK